MRFFSRLCGAQVDLTIRGVAYMAGFGVVILPQETARAMHGSSLRTQNFSNWLVYKKLRLHTASK